MSDRLATSALALHSRSAPWRLAAKNLFFPIFCRQCRARLLTEENGYYCPTCWELTEPIAPPWCPHCGRPHTTMVGLGNRRNFPCSDCRERPPDPIGRIYGTALYEGAIADAIRALKFEDKHRLAGPLGESLAQFAARWMDTQAYDLLVPVPLHRVRQRERGYNQSTLLAQACRETFSHATVCEDLKRIRPTQTQSKLAGERRADNVRGAFAALGDGFAKQRILLIDDVVTSGGTVIECARALMRAEAQSVDVLAVALVEHRASRNR